MNQTLGRNSETLHMEENSMKMERTEMNMKPRTKKKETSRTHHKRSRGSIASKKSTTSSQLEYRPIFAPTTGHITVNNITVHGEKVEETGKVRYCYSVTWTEDLDEAQRAPMPPDQPTEMEKAAEHPKVRNGDLQKENSERKKMTKEPVNLKDKKSHCPACGKNGSVSKRGGVNMCLPCWLNLRRTDRMEIKHSEYVQECPFFRCLVNRTYKDYMKVRFRSKVCQNFPAVGELIVINDPIRPIKLWILKSVRPEHFQTDNNKNWYFAVDEDKRQYAVELIGVDYNAELEYDLRRAAFCNMEKKIEQLDQMSRIYNSVDMKIYASLQGKVLVQSMPVEIWRTGIYLNFVDRPGLHPFGYGEMNILNPLNGEVRTEVFGQPLDGRSVNVLMAKICHIYGRDTHEYSFQDFETWRVPRTSGGKSVIHLMKHTGEKRGHFIVAEYRKDSRMLIIFDSGHFVRNNLFFNDVKNHIHRLYPGLYPVEDDKFYVHGYDELPIQSNQWCCGLSSIGNLIILLNQRNPADYCVNIGALWKYLHAIADATEATLNLQLSKEHLLERIAIRTNRPVGAPTKKKIQKYISF